MQRLNSFKLLIIDVSLFSRFYLKIPSFFAAKLIREIVCVIRQRQITFLLNYKRNIIVKIGRCFDF